MQKSRLSRGLRVTVAALVAFSLNLHAAEWVAEPSISLREGYNDNIRLITTADREDTWTTTLDPRLRLSRRTELWDLSASARVRAETNRGGNGLGNTVDNFFDLASKRRFERGSWDASASQVNDTTLQSEVLDLDTGLTAAQIDRTQRRFRLGTQYQLTETTRLEGAVDYTTVEFDDGGTQSRTDTNTLSPSLQLTHQLNPKIQLFGVYNHDKTDFDTDDNLESTTDSLQLGAAYDFTETWTLNGSVGQQRTQTTRTLATPVPRPGFNSFFPFIFDIVEVTDDDNTTGLVYNLNLSRKFETGNLSLSGTRSVRPSSSGASTDSTSVTLRGDRRFSAKLSGQLAVSYLQSSRIGNTGTTIRTLGNNRYRIAPSLTWRLDQDLLLNAGYTYTSVKRDRIGSDTADSNAAFIGLGYNWPRIAVSR